MSSATLYTCLLLVALVCLEQTSGLAVPRGELAHQRKSYDGYKVIVATARTKTDVLVLRRFMLDNNEVVIKKRPNKIGDRVEMLVSPELFDDVIDRLKTWHVSFTVMEHNVQPSVKRLYDSVDRKLVFGLDKFNTFADITSWLTSLAGQCRPGLTCQLQSLGNSHQNNPLHVFRISQSGTDRKAFYVDATTQSSDWIATSTILNLLDALARGTTAEAIQLTDEYDWHIVPVVNPDGYVYTFTSDRFWLKNRKPNGQCTGTNLNYNFDNEWGTEGVGHAPCSNDFCGVGPASEPETQRVQAEIRRLAPTLRGVLSLHSFGSAWTFPPHWTDGHQGLSCGVTSDFSSMVNVAQVAADAVGATHGTTWTSGSSCSILGGSSGAMTDYAKYSGGVVYSFMVELRGSSFVIDESEIQPAFEEFMNGLVAMVDAIVPDPIAVV